MSSSVDKSTGAKKLLSGQNITYLGMVWGVFSLFLFLLFSITAPEENSPVWYVISTYILELVPFLCAGFLCYRNFRSPQIASGRKVWLGIGLGMICFFLGGIFFGIWEVYFGLEPDVSPADFFYMAFYIFIAWGMFLAVLPRRLNLESWQWIVIFLIAVAGIAFAAWIVLGVGGAEVSGVEVSGAEVSGAEVSGAEIALEEATEPVSTLPAWVTSTDELLSQFADPVNIFYIAADVGLLIIASTLLLAFWGGRFSQSWRMIAAATFAQYIADMWSQYAYTFIENYESGDLLEVFYVFSGILFAIGAALEYEISTSRPSRGRRRRGGS